MDLIPPVTGNSVRIIESILDTPLPFKEALAFYNAIQESTWRDDTDIYLNVHLSTTSWDVVEVKSHTLSSGLQHTLVLAYVEDHDDLYSHTSGRVINGQYVSIQHDLSISVKDDDIIWAQVRAY